MSRSTLRRGRRMLAPCLCVAVPALMAVCLAPAAAAGSNVSVLATPISTAATGPAAAAATPDPAPVWVATASGPGGRAAGGRVVVRAPRGGALYVAGEANVSGRGTTVMVVKYGAAGATQWTATFRGAGAGPQTAVDAAVDRAGDLIVLCAVSDPRTGGDWAVLKYGPDGARAWATTIAGAGRGDDVPAQLRVTADGAIYAVGGLVAAHRGLRAAVVKLTLAGHIVWRRSIAAGRVGRFVALGLDRSGRVFCAGVTGTAARSTGCLAAAYSPAGRQLWVARWGSATQAGGGVSDIAVTPAGASYVVGWYGTASGSRAMVRRYGAGGRFVGQLTYGTKTGGRDRFVAAALLPDGHLVATGTLVDTKTGNSNIVTVGFSAAGKSLWQQVWDTPHPPSGYSHDEASGVAVDATGRVFVVGTVDGGAKAAPDYGVLAYTKEGLPMWTTPRTWDGGAADYARALAPAPGGVVVTGLSRHAGRSRMATVKLPY